MTILGTLNKKLVEIFEKLGFDKKYAFFQYSDRPDLSDFQTNCAMPLSKTLKKSPREVAELIVPELEKTDLFEKITIDGPGFINATILDKELFNNINLTIDDNKLGFEPNQKPKKVLIDYGGYNVAKELHVGHLRSTVIGESIRKIYIFAGDNVIGDVHLGDWGLNMGMTIEGIRLKYPNAECFKGEFNKNKIDDLKLTSKDLLEVYKLANTKAKEDEEFANKVAETVKMLQDGYSPYRTLWKYFLKISVDDIKEIADILNTHYDLWNGESDVHELIGKMVKELSNKKLLIESQGAKIIDLSELDIPPVIVVKSNGAFMYPSTDLATILDRKNKYNPDLTLYVVDYRQSLYFKQVFEGAKKVGYLDENHTAEHLPFGTMNGKDGKPFKTRSGDTVKLRDLINETTEIISEKSTIKDKDIIQKIAVASLKFADLINFRESSYIFDMEQFTNYEGKTGAYVLYSLVRINSILASNKKFDYKITEIRTKEERDLLVELSKFSTVFKGSYDKKAPNFLAEYVYMLAKKFSSFYSTCQINNEADENYKKSKLSLIYVTKQYIEICLDLLGISAVDKM